MAGTAFSIEFFGDAGARFDFFHGLPGIRPPFMMVLVSSLEPLREPQAPPVGERCKADGAVPFAQLYEEHFDFVWRSLRRLGVPVPALDDAVQDAFVVVHRKLPEFEGRSSLRGWLFGIALRVARDYRRAASRKRSHGLVPAAEADTAKVADSSSPSPFESAARAEAIRLMYAILDELDDDKREVLVMGDLELMTVPDIAAALGANVNTVYSRLRAARVEVEEAIARHRAREGWRQR